MHAFQVVLNFLLLECIILVSIFCFSKDINKISFKFFIISIDPKRLSSKIEIYTYLILNKFYLFFEYIINLICLKYLTALKFSILPIHS